jgi:hypothetical protein
MFKDAAEMECDEAWAKMKEADAAKDLDNFKIVRFHSSAIESLHILTMYSQFFNAYAKAVFIKHTDGKGNSIELHDIEQGFRSENMNMHFIAKVCSTSPSVLLTRSMANLLTGRRDF